MTAPPSLTHVAHLVVTVAPPVVVGRTDQGRRVVIPITGGTVSGPALRGVVLPGGADWNTAVRDGLSHVSARYTVRTDDGHHVDVTNVGWVGAGPDGVPAGRTTPSFGVDLDGPYAAWAHATHVGTLRPGPDGAVVLDFFRVG